VTGFASFTLSPDNAPLFTIGESSLKIPFRVLTRDHKRPVILNFEFLSATRTSARFIIETNEDVLVHHIVANYLTFTPTLKEVNNNKIEAIKEIQANQ